jgi:hypothetical protein
MGRGPLLIGGLVLAMRLATFPRTPWDPEELRFPFTAMLVITIAASVVTAVALAKAYGSAASLLFSFSAAVLVHGGSARLEVVAWMFVALALLVFHGRSDLRSSQAGGRSSHRPTLFGALAGAAVACHPPLLIGMLAMLFSGLHLMPGVRLAAGGPAARDEDPRYLSLRAWAPYLAFGLLAVPFLRVPENLSEVGALNVVRFVLHPWGSKWVAVPLLACLTVGILRSAGEWRKEHEPLLWFAVVHLATGLAFVHPGEGVRWAVPSLIFTALVASRAGWVGAAIVSALSVGYAYPILRDRVQLVSPPIQAARAIPDGVQVLHDRDMAPFAGGVPLDDGLRRHLETQEPLLFVTNGLLQGARVFSRPDADAYGKLTRNAYHQVSLLPIASRYAPVHGVYGLERDDAGESWRWLEREAAVDLPRGRRAVRVVLRADLETVVTINGMRIPLPRGEVVTVDVPPADVLEFRAAREHRLPLPDTRVVAVRLLRIDHR